MKKKLVIAGLVGIMLTMCFAACSKKEEKKSEEKHIIVQEGDEVFEESFQGNDMSMGCCQTEAGYYLLSNTFKIHYIDRESMEATPLCFDPDCSHPDNDNCQAYFLDNTYLQVYKGKLYADRRETKLEDRFETKVCLYEMELDGSSRRKVMDLYDSRDNGTYGDSFHTEWRIVGDKLYVMGDYQTGTISSYAYMDCYSGEGWKNRERIMEWEHIEDRVVNSHGMVLYYDASDKSLYCTRTDWKDGYNEETGGYDLDGDIYMEVENLQEKTSKKILEDLNKISPNWLSMAGCRNQIFGFADGSIYYYNKNTGKSEKLVQMEEKLRYSTFWADRNYLYVNNSPALEWEKEEGGINPEEGAILQIYNIQGELVDTMKMPIKEGCIPLDGEDKQFYLMGYGNNEVYYMDKTKIGTGELEMIKIEGIK